MMHGCHVEAVNTSYGKAPNCTMSVSGFTNSSFLLKVCYLLTNKSCLRLSRGQRPQKELLRDFLNLPVPDS